MGFEHEPAGYQVCLHVGPAPERLSSARCVDITPLAPTPDAVLGAIEAAALVAADLRAKTLLSLDTDPTLAILIYTAAAGFAGRPLDVLVGDRLIDAGSLHSAGLSLHQPRPTTAIDVFQVGALTTKIASLTLTAPLSAQDATAIRWARRLRFIPDPDTATALSQFIVVTALRARPQGERYPLLCDGTEPAPEPASPLEPVGIDLDPLRLSALTLRRAHHSGERDSIADFLESTPRLARLYEAGEYPISTTLARLGARHNDESDLWHCPRPERHTHGDATASMRVQHGRVRCYVCDPERVDSLRLVMDCLSCSPDEAADWILSDADSRVDQDQPLVQSE